VCDLNYKTKTSTLSACYTVIRFVLHNVTQSYISKK